MWIACGSRPLLIDCSVCSEEGAVIDQVAWLRDYWGGHPAANLFLMAATRHNLVHLNEIARMRSKLGQLPARVQ